MELSDRIKKIIEYKDLSIPRFAVALGVKTPQAIRELIKGNTKSLSADMQNKILAYIPELNRDWLLFGEGEMLNATGFDEVPDSEVVNLNPKPGDKYTLVPLVNIDSVGGMDSSNDLSWREQYAVRHIPFIDARKDDLAIYQSGDSMSPGIPSGSILQIRQIHDWREYLGYGDTFVLWLKDNRRITKQVLRYDPDPMHYVICHSFNPEYADEELSKNFIKQVWKVLAVLSGKGW